MKIQNCSIEIHTAKTKIETIKMGEKIESKRVQKPHNRTYESNAED